MIAKTKYVEKFKDIYKAKTGKTLSDADALHEFENLVLLVEAIYKPITKNYERK